MRAVIQRVSHAKVEVDGQIVGAIGSGLLVFLAFADGDTSEDQDWILKKTSQMRIFSDDAGKMNLSLKDISGGLLIVSQFTLFASTKKGNRPSFIRSAAPDIAERQFNEFVESAKRNTKLKVESGRFGANMQVSLLNDGPVTISLDSKNKE